MKWSCGGGVINNGALGNGGWYEPGTNSWMPTSTVNAPVARVNQTAVWTGTDTVVWGGTPDFIHFLNRGEDIIPSTNSWTSTATVSAPIGAGCLIRQCGLEVK